MNRKETLIQMINGITDEGALEYLQRFTELYLEYCSGAAELSNQTNIE